MACKYIKKQNEIRKRTVMTKCKNLGALADPRNHKGVEIWLPVAESSVVLFYFYLISGGITSLYFFFFFCIDLFRLCFLFGKYNNLLLEIGACY